MPTSILRPVAQGSYTDYILIAGATKTLAVDPGDPVSHDDLTSYIAQTGGAGTYRDSQKVGALPGTVGNPTLVNLKSRSSVAGGPTTDIHYHACRLGATLGTENNLGTPPGSFTTFTTDITAARPGGGSWLRTDFDAQNAQNVVREDYVSAASVVTSQWFEVTADFLPGGFISLVACLGPLAAVLLREMPALAAALYAKTRTLVLPSEYLAAWHELREDLRARHFLMST